MQCGTLFCTANTTPKVSAADIGGKRSKQRSEPELVILSIHETFVPIKNIAMATKIQKLKPFSEIPSYKFTRALKEFMSLDKSKPNALEFHLSSVFKSLMNEQGIALLDAGPLKPPTLLISKPDLVEEFMRASGSRPARSG